MLSFCCLLVSSSDAKNIKLSIRQEGNEIVINGHKWQVSPVPLLVHFSRFFSCRWISGAGDPRTKLHLVMGKSDPQASTYKQQSVVIVPADAPGVKVVRPLTVFGYDDAPEGHCEITYDNVRVPLGNLVLGWGRGFEVRSILIAVSCSVLMFAWSCRSSKADLGVCLKLYVTKTYD